MGEEERFCSHCTTVIRQPNPIVIEVEGITHYFHKGCAKRFRKVLKGPFRESAIRHNEFKRQHPIPLVKYDTENDETVIHTTPKNDKNKSQQD